MKTPSCRGTGRLRRWVLALPLAAALSAGVCGSVALAVQDSPADPPEPRQEFRFSLSLTEEGSWTTGLRTTGARNGNLVLVQPRFAWKRGERWSLVSNLAGTLTTRGETRVQLRVKETYAVLSAGDFDFAAGKRLLKWSVGFAFTPAGVLDPPRSATDPIDRLNLNEGRELVMGNWIKGRHSVTAAWASGGLLADSRPGMHETLALRYNAMVAGFDASVIVAQDRGRSVFAGAGFTRVLGDAFEVHGEFGHRESSTLMLGGKYTRRGGFTSIFEFYTPGETAGCGAGGPAVGLAPTASSAAGKRRGHYGFIYLSKSRLRELPGWKEWDLSGSMVTNFRDGSRVWILEGIRRIGDRYSAYLRVLRPGGRAGRSEYGMMPFASLISAGIRVQI